MLQRAISGFTRGQNLSTLAALQTLLWAAMITNGERVMGFETPGKAEEGWQNAIFSVDEILEDARNGRMFIFS